MDAIIWASKSFYKMLIIVMLVEIMNLKVDWWYHTILLTGFAASLFSSIPYSNKKNN